MLTACCERIERDSRVERVLLGGLSEPETQALLTALGEPALAVVAPAVHRDTNGNPLFIREIARHLAGDSTGYTTAASLGGGVDSVIAGRLRRLDDQVRGVLAIAAVVGTEFDLSVVDRVSRLAEDGLLDALDAAVQAGIVTERDAPAGRFAFTHALVREALYDGLGASRRELLHRRVAAALESLEPRDAGRPLELARHHLRGASRDTPGPAAAFSALAGRTAFSQLAYEEAAAHYERALAALGTNSGTGLERGRLLLELGRAQQAAGLAEPARTSLLAAAAAARAEPAPDLLARCALALAGTWLETGVVDAWRVHILEEALAAIGDRDSGMRARLLARLALEVYYEGPERREAVSAEAVDMARRVGDYPALARALMSRRVALAGSSDVQARLAVVTEMLGLAEAGNAKELALWGLTWRAVDLLEGGDALGAFRELDTYGRIARELRRPAYLWQVELFRGMRALFDGRFAAVEAAAEAGRELGERATDPNAAHYLAILTFALRLEQGRLQEVRQAVRDYAHRYAAIPAWRCGEILLDAEIGDDASARRKLEQIAAKGFADLPRDINWLPAMAWLSLACVRLRDMDRADALYALMLPCAGRVVTTGHPIFCLGSMDRYLGLLAVTLGKPTEATGHLEAALDRNGALASPPLIAHTRVELARQLACAGPEGAERAEDLARDALAAAQRIGMPAVIEEADAVLASLDG